MPAPWLILLGWLLVINAVTFGAFAMDKRAARRGTWRTRERNLLLLELAGGFVGGWAAMQLLRHKTLHRSFTAMPVVAGALWVGAPRPALAGRPVGILPPRPAAHRMRASSVAQAERMGPSGPRPILAVPCLASSTASSTRTIAS